MPPPTHIPPAFGSSRSNTASSFPTSASSSTPSAPRRRRRVDSDPDPDRERDSSPPRFAPGTDHATASPDRKRPRPEHYISPSTVTPTAVTPTMSAKVQGKRLEVIDLTSPAGSAGAATPPHHRPSYAHSSDHNNNHNGRPQPQRPTLQPHRGSRKLVIKNFRLPSTSTSTTTSTTSSASSVDSYYERAHAELDSALSCIFAEAPPAQPLERLYRDVEDICRKGDAAALTERLRARCEAWLGGEKMLGGLFGAYDAAVGRDGASDRAKDVLLCEVVDRWRRWNKVVFVVRGVYSYLDRGHLLLLSGGEGGRGKQGINEMAIALFRKAVFGSLKGTGAVTPHGKVVLEGLCRLVDYARQGIVDQPTPDERANEALLKDAIGMVRLCGVYGKAFEPLFLVTSHRYFEHFAADVSAAYGLKDYIGAVGALLERESARCDGFNFESTTKRQLLGDAHHVLIEKYSEKLLDSGSVARLLGAQDVESMAALYELLKLSGLQKRLKEPWELYIRETGAAIVSDTERGDDMVVRLLELRRALDIMIRDAFSKDDVFSYGLRESFGHFINDKKKISSSWNTGTSKVGEMIAKYIDMLLRGGLKTLPKSLLSDNKDRADAESSGMASTADEDAELDRQLDHALELFRFIEGKDVFEAFYKKDLARRLLLGRSASQDAERSMLAKLKVECGSSFTHNLEQMFKDQELAKEEMSSYKEWLAGTGRSTGGIDLTVNILSAAAWPTFPDVRVLLPKEVLEQINTFDTYYKTKHTGRRLTWKHNMAHCVIKAQFNRGPKELLVSAPQAAVLLLFNEVEEGNSKNEDGKPAGGCGVLSYEQISQSTGLQGGELVRTLQSLACGKARVLTKHPKGREVAPTDTFTVNHAFTDPKFRVKINQVQLKETREENRATHERVAADRQFETQAAIVRIMKSRKTLTHAQLVAEVINQTKSRGAVDAADIKANIEKLIDKDYLERDGGSYNYLA
ncbi:627157d5-d2b9-41a2-a6f4-97640b2b10d4 [Thermothielavioides terrestris]|uniref:627157d5-d2b9-41a2-a6f4-97640b2b10d4 n=1 Tax=Thermothielavioides terrestris TaxID=2587410 RepID=A0A446BK10_9PEZI|nr:627157d5-d2b9-41a2-a6f4-97640b2b10d4 [Thermothielavioides terrestris]